MGTHLIVWGVVFAVMVIAELETFQLVSVWFAAGAAAAFVTALLGGEIWLQLLLFGSVSFLLLLFTRPLLKKLMVKKAVHTDSDIDIGKTALVIEEIDNKLNKGRVKLSGVDWRAVSEEDKVIPQGEMVEVKAVEGAKLYVAAGGK